MTKIFLFLTGVSVALLTGGCAQFDQALSTIGPSSTTSAGPSLMGTWSSTASIGAGPNSCTNFQWKLTGQQGNTASGDFSAVCGALAGSGTVTAQLNGNDIPFQISGAATVPGLSACSFSF